MLDFDVKKLKQDANSEEIKEEIKKSILVADSKEVSATPTLFIGLKKQLGVSTYQDLKQIVIEQGGKLKEVNE